MKRQPSGEHRAYLLRGKSQTAAVAPAEPLDRLSCGPAELEGQRVFEAARLNDE
jgi:hypothetical protein